MFKLHEKLLADTLIITDWPLCRVLLMKDRNYPWLILVPRQENISEIHQLSETDQKTLITEISCASNLLKSHTEAFKINVGALGNMVPQLHIHVIARFPDDPAWPGPVWGAVSARPYDPAELETMQSAMRDLLIAAQPAL